LLSRRRLGSLLALALALVLVLLHCLHIMVRPRWLLLASILPPAMPLLP
jgi:hypothetical protein